MSVMKAGRRYIVLQINTECNWFLERDQFEGRIMECIDDYSGIFRFSNPKECPWPESQLSGFLLYRPVLEEVKDWRFAIRRAIGSFVNAFS